MNLRQQITIIQNPSLTLGLTLGVTHPMGLGKCMTYVRRNNIID